MGSIGATAPEIMQAMSVKSRVPKDAGARIVPHSSGIPASDGTWKPKSEWPPAPKTWIGKTVSGFQQPTRYEGQIEHLEVDVDGAIPKEISGTFYRNMPDPFFPSFIANDSWINGDGNISAFRIKDGRAHFKQRYVQTEKLLKEKEVGRALMGSYRNPYTDLVNFKVRTVSNTNIIWWRGSLLSCKEDGPAYSMDPVTLETKGLYTFEGQYTSETFTAHPKFDPKTRELLAFGYQARGLGTRDVCYVSIDQSGVFNEEVWFKAPRCGFQHEMAMSEKYVIFPMGPLTCDKEAMEKKGAQHWEYDPEAPVLFGVLPRRNGTAADVKWFETAKGMTVGHVANAYEDDDGKIKVSISLAPGNALMFMPTKDTILQEPKQDEFPTGLVEFTIDYHSDNLRLDTPKILIRENNEMPRIDDRICGRKNTYIFGDFNDRSKKSDWDVILDRMGAGYPFFNSLHMTNVLTGKTEYFYFNDYTLFQEPVFCPRSADAPEGDGWLMALANNHKDFSSHLIILDTRNFSEAAAVIHLPLRLRMGIHGNWVDDADLDGHPPPVF